MKPLDADALMRYFEQLCEDANPAQEKFAYVLSLLLLQTLALGGLGKNDLGVKDPDLDGILGSDGTRQKKSHHHGGQG